MGFKFDQLDSDSIKSVLDFLPYPFVLSELREDQYHSIFINQKFVDEIGYTREQLPSLKEWFELAYPDPEYRFEVQNMWSRNTPEALAKVRIFNGRGDYRWYEVKASRTNRFEMIAFVSIHEEVSLREEMAKLSQNKNQILSIFAHDMRSPISSLRGLSELAIQSAVSPEQFGQVAQALNAQSEELLQFIETTLFWTRSNFDVITVKSTQVDVFVLVSLILKLYENQLQHKNIGIDFDLVNRDLFTDNDILNVVLRNLVSNAIKFTKDGGRITISSTKVNGLCYIIVADTGEGIGHAALHRILNDEHHTTSGTKSEKGFGMGLKLCRHLLQKIGGNLEIISLQGEGTQMKIVIKEEGKS